MEYKLSTIVTKEDDWYVAKGVEIEIASQGKTVEKALANLKEAFELWLEHADSKEIAPLHAVQHSPIFTSVEAVTA